jgi:hypothetical protein
LIDCRTWLDFKHSSLNTVSAKAVFGDQHGITHSVNAPHHVNPLHAINFSDLVNRIRVEQNLTDPFPVLIPKTGTSERTISFCLNHRVPRRCSPVRSHSKTMIHQPETFVSNWRPRVSPETKSQSGTSFLGTSSIRQGRQFWQQTATTFALEASTSTRCFQRCQTYGASFWSVVLQGERSCCCQV